ncbi:MAG: PAS domain-containing methyl-accepting chemotaxis protein [Leptospiraceae bacterium]|nr:PAS domain-containing methyl-accepting chemotaxis protein [Leptospiraceae bacterium]
MNTKAIEKEYPVEETSVLISRTNLKGVITYVSPDFAQISGYPPSELVGKPHNIIRHPDMPKSIFRSLWSTIKQNKPWSGVIKNKRQDGDYYWVDATVTPIRKNDTLIGYMSVRKKPLPGDIEKAKELYSLLLRAEKTIAFKLQTFFASIRASLSQKKFFISIVLFSVGLIYSIGNLFFSEWNLRNIIALGTQLIFLVLGIFTSMYFYFSKQKEENILLEAADYISSGGLKKSLKTFKQGGIFNKEILLHLKSISTGLWGVIFKIKLNSTESETLSVKLSKSTKEISELIQKQAAATEEITASSEELSATIHSISSSVETQTENISSIKEKIGVLDESMNNVKVEMGKLDEISDKTSKTAQEGDQKIQNLVVRIQEISSNSAKINEIVSLITAIADKTNLLSLNASIESARAGEAGRGFAVVAGEVSKLADQTAVSVKEITGLITSNNKIIHATSEEVTETVSYLRYILNGIQKSTTLQ